MTVRDIAIMTLFNSTSGTPTPVHNPLWLAINGALYNEEAPEQKANPYVVFHELSSKPEYTFSTSFEDTLMQFNIYSDTVTELDSVYEKLKTLFDMCQLSITGYTLVFMVRQQSRRMHIENYWQRIVEYKMYMEKN